ncbi:MAG TPA: DmsC/YnfH family molybdoenzyme membrane anchor subunit [Afifellaceae bacterium]|nr:DmsC/YnfH family molybdoenzyme membrane anchor subunit [Afifellaceae bacterium]
MYPAYSIIIFTSLSGTGFGLMALIGLGVGGSGPHPLVAPALAFGLAASGLVSSLFHLGHPERTLRALSQWRSSWMSREGVFALATFIAFAAHIALVQIGGGRGVASGLVLAVLAVATVYATAMIYASLATVAQWNTWLTPLYYVAFSLAGGLLASAALSVAGIAPSLPVVVAAMAMLAIAWALKMAWCRRAATARSVSTPQSATGLGEFGPVRLLERPHWQENYLTREMGYRVARKHAVKLRKIAVLAGAVLPLLTLVFAFAIPFSPLTAGVLTFGFVAHMIGILVERWLFFAEAKHAVMLYYGAATA